MTKPSKIAVILIAGLALANCSGAATPPGPDIEAIQAAATQSCLCERDTSITDKSGCSKNLDDLISDLEISEAIESSAPVAYSYLCIATPDGEECIPTEYSVTAALPDGLSNTLCTKAEAEAVECAYNAAYNQRKAELDSDDFGALVDASNKGDLAVELILSQIESGAKAPLSASARGCV